MNILWNENKRLNFYKWIRKFTQKDNDLGVPELYERGFIFGYSVVAFFPGCGLMSTCTPVENLSIPKVVFRATVEHWTE